MEVKQKSEKILDIIQSRNINAFISWLGEEDENKDFMIIHPDRKDERFPVIVKLVWSERVEMIKVLLQYNCDVNRTYQNRLDLTAFSITCLETKNIEILHLLLDDGCDINYSDEDKNPLVILWEDEDHSDIDETMEVFVICCEVGMELINHEVYYDGFYVDLPFLEHRLSDPRWEFYAKFQEVKNKRSEILEKKEHFLKQMCIHLGFTERTEHIILQYIGYQTKIKNMCREELWSIDGDKTICPYWNF